MFKNFIENQLIAKVSFKIPSKILGKWGMAGLPLPSRKKRGILAGGIAPGSLKQENHE